MDEVTRYRAIAISSLLTTLATLAVVPFVLPEGVAALTAQRTR